MKSELSNEFLPMRLERRPTAAPPRPAPPPRVAAPVVAVVLAIFAAFLATCLQAALHVATGGTPPPPSGYTLLGPIGGALIGAMANTAVFSTVLVVAFASFGGATVLLLRAGWRSSALASVHLEGERSCPLRCRPPGFLPGAGYLAIAITASLLFVYTALFAMASARADAFALPPDVQTLSDRLLRLVYTVSGLSVRPNWWLPLLAHLAAPVFAMAAIWGFARVAGFPFAPGTRRHDDPPPRALWEWGVVASMCVLALLTFLWRLGDWPWVIMQDSGIGARFGFDLVREGSQRNVFADPWIPNICFVPRALAAEAVGNLTLPLRLVSALVSSIGLVVAWLLYRSFFRAPTALALLFLTLSSHHVFHYSRMGTMHIDNLYWAVALLLLLRRAEFAPAGPWRLAVYTAVGAVAGFGFGLYPGAKLGMVAVATVVALRAFAQPDYWRCRWIDHAFMVAMALVMIAPHLLVPEAGARRDLETYLLRGDVLMREFARPGVADAGILTVEQLTARRMIDAVGLFHFRADNSHNYTSLFPLAGPLVGGLSLLGLALMLVHFRSWLTILLGVTFLAGCWLGGALRIVPDPPSSSRLMVLAPVLFLAAGVALDVVISAVGLLVTRLGWPYRQSRDGLVVLVAGIVLLLLVLLRDAATNQALYRRWNNEPRLMYHSWMMQSTQLLRYWESRGGRPERLIQFDVDTYANQTFLHMDYYWPDSAGKRIWVPENQGLEPEMVPETGLVWFVVHDDRRRMLDPIRNLYPGGRSVRIPPPPFEGYGKGYTIYEVRLPRDPATESSS